MSDEEDESATERGAGVFCVCRCSCWKITARLLFWTRDEIAASMTLSLLWGSLLLSSLPFSIFTSPWSPFLPHDMNTVFGDKPATKKGFFSKFRSKTTTKDKDKKEDIKDDKGRPKEKVTPPEVCELLVVVRCCCCSLLLVIHQSMYIDWWVMACAASWWYSSLVYSIRSFGHSLLDDDVVVAFGLVFTLTCFFQLAHFKSHLIFYTHILHNISPPSHVTSHISHDMLTQSKGTSILWRVSRVMRRGSKRDTYDQLSSTRGASRVVSHSSRTFRISRTSKQSLLWAIR